MVYLKVPPTSEIKGHSQCPCSMWQSIAKFDFQHFFFFFRKVGPASRVLIF